MPAVRGRVGGPIVAAAWVALSLSTLSCQPTEPPGAPLLQGMGAYHRPISTTVELAQRYFNQGLVLHYGFNHAEAARSFREALRNDPECAMCAWGIALALGPNINATMDPADNAEAVLASRQAVQLSVDGTAAEKALIEALSVRYQASPPEDRSALDLRYAETLQDVYERFPDDLDVSTLFAEAWMTTMPWDYWLENGEPKFNTVRVLDALESTLSRFPQHPGANHFYIHAVEAVQPERGVEAADRLGGLVPGAGHLVHMPSHIYLRVGRYHDATIANELAMQADANYDAQCQTQGLYPLLYMPHNAHFLWASATLEGRSELAIQAARQVADGVDPEKMREPGFGTLQHYSVTPLFALTRFGRWGEILLTPQPDADLIYPNGVWHYARTIALTRLARFEEARVELEQLRSITANPALEGVTLWDINTTSDLLRIATAVASGELAAAEGHFEEAIALLQQGVELEDQLGYDEPPPWHAPVRQTLGVVYLVAGRNEDAELIYREDLERYPENGWSLFGLMQSLRLQNERPDAAPVQARFRSAWEHADIELYASRM